MKHLKTFEEQTQKISIEDFDNFLDSIKNLSVTDIEKAIQMLREFSDKYPYIKTERMLKIYSEDTYQKLKKFRSK